MSLTQRTELMPCNLNKTGMSQQTDSENYKETKSLGHIPNFLYKKLKPRLSISQKQTGSGK